MNGVKGRIEKICAQMDISPDRVDLTTASHHDVSGVMKYFLRQLPEPLMMFSLYDSFLKIGKVFEYLLKVLIICYVCYHEFKPFYLLTLFTV